MNLYEQRPKELLEEFLLIYEKMYDAEFSRQMIADTFAFYAGGCKLPYQDDLRKRWYDSYDFSVYDADEYFADLWYCWIKYSRAYVRSLIKVDTIAPGESIGGRIGQVGSVLDIGCGLGYTTAALKQVVPGAIVVGTNLEDTKQWKFCEHMSRKYCFALAPDVHRIGIPSVDLLFASEYFEHIERPLEHLTEVIEAVSPRFMFIANSFNTTSIGHFLEYKDGDEIHDQKHISRLFNAKLKHHGYEKVKTKLWNNKPAFWERKAQ